MKLVFMGTPEFAVPTFKALLDSRHEVAAVVTQPDRPKGRGRKLSPPAVKIAALEADIPVFQPESMKDTTFLAELESLQADCFIVVAFRILPPAVYEMPPKGTFNLHTSLLPKYRGAAPMQWAIINGDEETGLTTFLLDRKVDTGAILLQERLTIAADDNLGSLHDRMAVRGAALVLETLEGLEAGTLKPMPQTGKSCGAPKILPEHLQLSWKWTAREIVNRVRGLAPRPGANTYWQGKRIKVFAAEIADGTFPKTAKPGQIVSISTDGIVLQASDRCIKITELQMEGRKRMNTDAFLRGCALHAGDGFTDDAGQF